LGFPWQVWNCYGWLNSIYCAGGLASDANGVVH
jgi:hypothetical protein